MRCYLCCQPQHNICINLLASRATPFIVISSDMYCRALRAIKGKVISEKFAIEIKSAQRDEAAAVRDEYAYY